MPSEKNSIKKKPQDGLATMKDVLLEFWKSMRIVKIGYFATVILFIVATILGSIIVPLYFKKFFDILSVSQDPHATVPLLIHIVLVILVLNVGALFCRRLASYLESLTFVRVSADLRERAFAYFIGHSYSFFSNNFTGSLVQRIARLARSFNNITDRFFYNIIPTSVRVVGIVTVLWFTYRSLAWALGGWIIFLFLSSYFVAQWKLKYSLLTAEADSRVSAATSDSIGNHTTIQLFSGAGHENNRFVKIVREHAALWLKRWSVDMVTDSIQGVLSATIQFVVFYITIKHWGEGGVTVGVFVLAQTYIISLNDDLWQSSRIVRDMYESFAEAKEAVDILKLPHSIRDVPNAAELSVAQGAIEYRNVRFSFDDVKSVVNDICLSITPGERVAFIGPSGAGKSTLVRLILRLYDIGSGCISIDGQDISKVTQESLRNAISFVPQDPILFHRTLMDNIRYGRFDATDEEVIRAAKLAHCDDFISSFPQGYETFVGERGVKLSGGERQRVAIARAMLKNAPILILDEATSSLDSHSETLIQDALDTLMKGKTVIVIAHRLSTIRKMDRIVVISHGSVLEEGNHEQLIARGGMYAKLWSLQSGGFIKEDVE
ncbi:MAG: hypothetical protein JWO73_512 [Candidatus Taylorbacteria bacterium]|nr:hypothetical protein [Candidatus Taylorbacteria bacterium]